jgi:hypothetical protein
MAQIERIWEFLQRLTPLTRSCLLTELERLALCGEEFPGSGDILNRLRAEFRKDGPDNRANSPSRVFFLPLDPFLIDGAPEHDNPGRIPRGSIAPIWEWIGRDLLPTMTRDFNAKMKDLIAADKQREIRQVASAYQTKVVKYLESTLGSPDAAAQTRLKLASYTASRSAYGDLVKMLCVLRARDALARFEEALPKKQIVKFDNTQVDKMIGLLNAFGKTNADALPFAITLIAKRLKTPWHILRLATKTAASRKAADVAAAPFAVAVNMVLDRIDDDRAALRIALRNNRVVIAKALLTDAYDIEYAVRVRIDKLDESEWGERLRSLMDAIADLVEAEIKRFPDEVGHVLGSRSLRGYQSLTGRLTFLAWKGRDAITNGASFCMKLINAA